MLYTKSCVFYCLGIYSKIPDPLMHGNRDRNLTFVCHPRVITKCSYPVQEAQSGGLWWPGGMEWGAGKEPRKGGDACIIMAD